MASIIIRRLDEGTKRRLRLRAVTHGRSMEEEARTILKSVLSESKRDEASFVQAVRRHISPLGGVVLPEIPRDPMREPPGFDQ